MKARQIIVSIAIAIAGLGLRPAIAADTRQLSCPTDRLTRQERAAFLQGVREQAPRTDSRFNAFRNGLDDCARTLGWTSERADLARLYNLVAASQAEMRLLLEGLGVDVAAIERALLADTALLAAAGSGQYPEALVNAFIGRLDPSAEELAARQPAGTDVLTPIGTYIAARAIMESARTRFAAH